MLEHKLSHCCQIGNNFTVPFHSSTFYPLYILKCLFLFLRWFSIFFSSQRWGGQKRGDVGSRWTRFFLLFHAEQVFFLCSLSLCNQRIFSHWILKATKQNSGGARRFDRKRLSIFRLAIYIFCWGVCLFVCHEKASLSIRWAERRSYKTRRLLGLAGHRLALA